MYANLNFERYIVHKLNKTNDFEHLKYFKGPNISFFCSQLWLLSSSGCICRGDSPNGGGGLGFRGLGCLSVLCVGVINKRKSQKLIILSSKSFSMNFARQFRRCGFPSSGNLRRSEYVGLCRGKVC